MAPRKKVDQNALFGGTFGSGDREAELAKSKMKDVEDELDRIAKDMQKLHSVYELYFMGIERTEPLVSRDQIRRRIRAIRDLKLRNPRIKFRLQDLQSRFVSFENYWGRINRMREEGRYHRDKVHVRRRQVEGPAPAPPETEKKPAAPDAQGAAPSAAIKASETTEGKSGADRLAARRRPLTSQARPSASKPDDLTDATLRTLYDAYSVAKKRCGEPLDVRFEDMASALRKQVPKLLKETGASSVEFKVVIKQGHATLKAVPKS